MRRGIVSFKILLGRCIFLLRLVSKACKNFLGNQRYKFQKCKRDHVLPLSHSLKACFIKVRLVCEIFNNLFNSDKLP